MKTCPVGAELLHGDRQTDMRKLKPLFAVLRTGPKIVLMSQLSKEGFRHYDKGTENTGMNATGIGEGHEVI
jgi:hypothetical protein